MSKPVKKYKYYVAEFNRWEIVEADNAKEALELAEKHPNLIGKTILTIRIASKEEYNAYHDHLTMLLNKHTTATPLMIFNSDNVFLGQVVGRFTENQYKDIDGCMHKYWQEWKKEVKQPDSDSQFIDWLIENKGFQECFIDIVPVQITEI